MFEVGEALGRLWRRSPYLRTHYAQELQLTYYTNFRVAALGLGGLLLVGLPLWAHGYLLTLAVFVLIYLIGAVGLQVVTGLAGQLSLGQAAFMAVGAFVGGAAHFHLGTPFPVNALLAVATGGFCGYVLSFPALRFRGIYLAVVTLAFHFIVITLLREYQLFLQTRFGTLRDIVLPDPAFGPLVLGSDRAWYWFLLAAALAVLLMAANLVRSPYGRAWVAIRDHDVGAEAVGLDVRWYKRRAFVVSSALTALAGCLHAYYTHTVSADNYGLTLAVMYLAMVIVGGLGSLRGAVWGTLFVVLTPELLSGLLRGTAIARDPEAVRMAVFAGLLITFLLAEPKGLEAVRQRVWNYFELWPFKYRPLEGSRR